MQLIEQTLDDTLGESQASATPVAPSNTSPNSQTLPKPPSNTSQSIRKTLLAFPSAPPRTFRNISQTILKHTSGHIQTPPKSPSSTSQSIFTNPPKHLQTHPNAFSNTSAHKAAHRGPTSTTSPTLGPEARSHCPNRQTTQVFSNLSHLGCSKAP